MRTLKIHLNVNNQPAIVEMVEPKVSRKHFPSDAYGQAPINRVLIANDTQVACVSVDGSLDWWVLRSVADKYRLRHPDALRLGGHILAIHYIKVGRGWPEDANSEPTSILNCLPVEQWTRMANKPPVVISHPLINQPAGTVAFQCPMSAGMPVVVHYDSIAAVNQLHDHVIITLCPAGNGELLGCAVVDLRDERAAVELAAGLRLRRVKRISHNELVEAVLLYPNAELCRGHERRIISDADCCMDLGLDGLFHNALEAHPMDVRNALREWGVV